MNMKIVLKITAALLSTLVFLVVPLVPASLVLKGNLPEVTVGESILPEDAIAIIYEARGGSFVSLGEVFAGVVNQPFTYIERIQPENLPYYGLADSQVEILIGHGWYVDSMSGGGYKVFLKKTEGSWVVVQRREYLI